MAEHAEVLRGLAKTMQVVGMVLVAVGAVLAVLGFGGAFMVAGFLLWEQATPWTARRIGPRARSRAGNWRSGLERRSS